MKQVKILKILAIPVLILFAIFLYYFNTSGDPTSRNISGAVTNIQYEKAMVLKVLSQSLQKDDSISGLYRGTQDLEVKILTGEHKGEVRTEGLSGSRGVILTVPIVAYITS